MAIISQKNLNEGIRAIKYIRKNTEINKDKL
jgi:hypothetical protein